MLWVEAIILWLSKLGLSGAFLVGFLGSAIPFFPSYFLIPIMGAEMNPLMVGVIAGVGSGLGQFLHYYIGYGGRRVFSEEMRARFDKWHDRFEKNTFWLIMFLAATPLTPDDLIWIPLGLIKYPIFKALIAGIIGKMILCTIYALAGYYALNWLVGLI